ncbi:hypothetical protein XENTR_v10007321 [Xenopus tropicalis]|nr:hypothetical protein XENTR_v10007321 [Xenopus tropicalis]
MDTSSKTENEAGRALNETTSRQNSASVRERTPEPAHRRSILGVTEGHRPFDSTKLGNVHIEADKYKGPVFVSKLSLTRRRAARLLRAQNTGNGHGVPPPTQPSGAPRGHSLAPVDTRATPSDTLAFVSKLSLTRRRAAKLLGAKNNRNGDAPITVLSRYQGNSDTLGLGEYNK